MMYPKPTRTRRKPEKVEKIQLQFGKVCWVCGAIHNLEDHHVFGGPLRKKSEKYGLKVWLCHNHHNENIPGDPGVHFNPTLRNNLKWIAQLEFERVYGHEKFMQEFGRSYL